MLDRESQIHSSIVRWSTDGNSFIVLDHNQFEDVSTVNIVFSNLHDSPTPHSLCSLQLYFGCQKHVIPSHFDHPIVFPSFVRKLYRWGFTRMPRSNSDHYEFCSPTFRRFGADSATASTDASGNAGGGASFTNPQRPPNLLQTSQADALAALLSNIQRNNLCQPPPLPSQQSINANSILQDYVEGIQSILQQQQPIPSMNLFTPNPSSLGQADPIGALLSNIQRNNQHNNQQQPPLPNQQPINANSILQGQQQQSNSEMNLLNAALNIFAGGQTPSPQLQGDSSQSIAIRALLSGILPAQPSPPNTSFVALSQSNSAVPSLLTLMHRLIEEERQRRAQADAAQNAIMATIGRILSQGVDTVDEEERQSRVLNLNAQADPIAAILQAVRRGEAGQLQEDTRVQGDSDDSQCDSDDDDQYDARPTSASRKRKSPEEEEEEEEGGGGGGGEEDDVSFEDCRRPGKK